MGTTKEENETIIRFDETNAPAIVYTASRFVRLRMDRLVEGGHAKLKRQDENGAEYLVDKALVSVRPKRKVSEEQKERTRQMFAQLREAKEEESDDEEPE
jgi:hypothetical protein